MDLPFSITLLCLLVVFVASTVWLGRDAGGPRPLAPAAWSCLLAGGLVAGSTGTLQGLGVAEILASMFPLLLLASELERARLRPPGWLLPLLGVLALLRGASMAVDPRLAPLLAVVVDAPVLVACGAIAWHRPGLTLSPMPRTLPIALALLCVPRVVDAWADWSGASSLFSVSLWFGFGAPVVALQVFAGISLARRETDAARAALAASVRRFDLIASGAFDLVSETDSTGRFLYVSPSCRTVLGWEPEELIGTDGFELLHPGDRDAVAQFKGAVGDRREQAHPRLRLKHRDGSWRVFEGTTRRYWNDEGLERIVVVTRDVGDRLRFEQNARNAQRFESLLLLAKGIAHDFNNLLVPVLTSVDLMRRELPPGGPEGDLLSDLEAGARRATELARQLLDLSGQDRERLASIDLSALVGEVTRLFVRTLPRRVSLHSKLSPGLPLVEGDPSRLRQVVTSLLANAIDALGESGGSIEVSTGVLEIRPGDRLSLEMNADLAPGSYVHLDIGDDGPGVDPDVRDRIFDPFVSTKPAGHGLGLAVLMGTVRSLGGAVEVRNSPGPGTVFRILLPPTAVSSKVVAEGDASPTLGWRGRGRILLVDDEDTVRRAARRALESLGFTVVEARSGSEAIEIFRRTSSEIEAVVLDAVMPELSGDQTYDRLCQIRADPPVLLTSGYVERAVVDRLTARPRVRFLPKPFTVAGLGEALRALLETEAGGNS